MKIAACDTKKAKTFDQKEALKEKGFEWGFDDDGFKSWHIEARDIEQAKEIITFLVTLKLGWAWIQKDTIPDEIRKEIYFWEDSL